MAAMMMAVLYGYQISEIVWDVEDNLIIPKKIESKAARWFVYSDENELRFKTKVNMVQGEPLPPRKFLATRFHPTYDDPYAGREAVFNALYWPVQFRHMLMEFSIQFAEKYGCPWIDISAAAGLESERLNEAAQAIQNSYNQGIIAHYDDVEMKVMDIGGSKNSESYVKLIDLFNKEIDMAILGQNLTTEVKGGSFAASKTHMGVRDDIIQEDRRMIESVMNELIEWIYWYNFNTSENIPKFKMHKSEPATEEKAKIDLALAQMGVKFNKSYFSRTYGINDEDFEIGIPPAVQMSSSLPAGGIPTADGLESPEQKQENTNTEDLVVDEQRDPAVNNSTKNAILRAQSKGYPY
jgi:phage gp29-like protein